MCSGDGNWTLLQLGFPIRTSPDHSSVVNFPGLIADSYVLLRLLMPRHPPCALSSLSFFQYKIATKMLASTMQFSRYGRYLTRCIRVPAAGEPFEGGAGPKDEAPRRSIPQDPTVCLIATWPTVRISTPPCAETEDGCTCLTGEPGRAPNSRRSTKRAVLPETNARGTAHWTGHPEAPCQLLLRKEVIQPHLPVRLPCYDFVPIASPTFDGSLHKGWATGFGCCRLS